SAAEDRRTAVRAAACRVNRKYSRSRNSPGYVVHLRLELRLEPERPRAPASAGALVFPSLAYALGSANNPPDHTPLHQLARLVQVVVDDRLRVDADRVVDSRQEIGRVDRVFQRGAGRLVALAVDEAALDAGAQ